MLEFEVVESLLALSRNLLAVVERLLAPSFCELRKFARRGGHRSPTKKSSTQRMKPPTAGSVGSRGHGVVLRVRWWVGLVVRFVCVIRVCRVCSGSPPGFFDGLVIRLCAPYPKGLRHTSDPSCAGFLSVLRGTGNEIVTRWSAACRRWFLVALLS
jgi:hypothetical protein